eukprot:scaffold25845_cov112-Isochrysis_galbana.AAC.6
MNPAGKGAVRPSRWRARLGGSREPLLAAGGRMNLVRVHVGQLPATELGRKKTLCGFLTWRVPTDGWHRSPTLTAADGGSMPGPAKHPSLRHPRTIRYVQPPTGGEFYFNDPYPGLASLISVISGCRSGISHEITV